MQGSFKSFLASSPAFMIVEKRGGRCHVVNAMAKQSDVDRTSVQACLGCSMQSRSAPSPGPEPWPRQENVSGSAHVDLAGRGLQEQAGLSLGEHARHAQAAAGAQDRGEKGRYLQFTQSTVTITSRS